jgi:hypothetical protein
MSAIKKGIPQDRARASQILAQIDALTAELDGLKNADLGGAKADIVDMLDGAVGDAREIVGDELTTVPRKVPDANGTCSDCTWQIAAKPPMTRKQLDAELEARGTGRTA